jgi:C-8 sterol isomerase
MATSPSSWPRRLTLLSLLLPLLYILYGVAESQLATGRFYIFDPPTLHDLSQRAIAAHGNDTSKVVGFVVDELGRRHGELVNLREEWIFNNAGGAMGAMWILHASMSRPFHPDEGGTRRGHVKSTPSYGGLEHL